MADEPNEDTGIESPAAAPETSEGSEQPQADTPAWLSDLPEGVEIPQKFVRDSWAETMAEIAKGHGSLEKMISGRDEKPKDDPPDDNTPAEPPAATDDPLGIPKPPEDDGFDPADLIGKAGLDESTLYEQWKEKGDLTPAQFAAIQKADPSMTPSRVRAIAKGLVAEADLASQQQTAMKSEAAKIAGGAEQLDQLLSSASEFVPADEIEDLDQRLRSPKHFKGAMRDLVAFHRDAVGAGKTNPIAMGDPAPAGPQIRTRDEYFDLRKKVQGEWSRGVYDTANQRAFSKIDESQFS